MFEILRDQPRDTVIGGVYFANRLIKHRNPPRSSPAAYIVPGVKSEPNAEEQELACQLIGEIEAREGVPLAQVDAARIEEYTVALSDALMERVFRDMEFDPEREARAQRILDEMRVTYAFGKNY